MMKEVSSAVQTQGKKGDAKVQTVTSIAIKTPVKIHI